VTLDDANGFTRDVSTSGVFFTFQGWPASLPVVDQHIKFRLTLEHADPRGPFYIGCEGHVVRVEQAADAVGVAVSITDYDLSVSQDPSAH
jgi:hypothetical protein